MQTYVYTLTKIDYMAFANNATATELTIPATVTDIADLGLMINTSLKKHNLFQLRSNETLKIIALPSKSWKNVIFTSLLYWKSVIKH